MNEHDQIQADLAVYAALEPKEHQRIEPHLVACAACADTLASYQKMDQALHQFADSKARYLATQLIMQPKPMMPQPSSERRSLRLIQVEHLLGRFIHQPALVLQLAGASVLILLLIMISLLLAGQQPNEQHLRASTPVVVEPTATATPSNPGVWAHQLAVAAVNNRAESGNRAGNRVQIVEAMFAQVHFAPIHFDWRWDNFVDQTITVPLPRRNSAAPWDAIEPNNV